MTMQEAINHAKEVAEEKYKEGFLCYANSGDVENDKKNDECVKCAKEHEQLAEWLEELQQYRAIGTVEECREAREKQRGKKPEHFHKKYGKHKWRRTESGEIDECAWDFGNHNGVACEICGETVCVLCNPNYDELDDCEEEYWICPNCRKKIYCKDEYCQCGQHLDWSDTPWPTK